MFWFPTVLFVIAVSGVLPAEAVVPERVWLYEDTVLDLEQAFARELDLKTHSQTYRHESHDLWVVIDRYRPKYYVAASLSTEGQLELNFFLKDSSGRSWIRGRQAFDWLMEFFGPHRVKSVLSLWLPGSSNFETFSFLADIRGYPYQYAAQQTFTGKQVGRYGFRSVTDVSDFSGRQYSFLFRRASVGPVLDSCLKPLRGNH